MSDFMIKYAGPESSNAVPSQSADTSKYTGSRNSNLERIPQKDSFEKPAAIQQPSEPEEPAPPPEPEPTLDEVEDEATNPTAFIDEIIIRYAGPEEL